MQGMREGRSEEGKKKEEKNNERKKEGRKKSTKHFPRQDFKTHPNCSLPFQGAFRISLTQVNIN